MKWMTGAPMAQDLRELMGVVGLVFIAAACARGWRRQAPETHRRGALIEASPRRRRVAAMPAPAAALHLAGVPLSFPDETKHFKVIGTTGTGKSTAIRELLGGALARGDRAVFADPDGGYRDCFFNRYRGDTVLNPFEPQSATWDPFAEIAAAHDVEELAAGLIPRSDDAGSDEWRAHARIFVTAVVRRCHGDSRRSAAELWRLLCAAPREELRSVVANTPAQSFLDADNARMFASIRSVALSAVAALEHVQGQRGVPFSVRRWVRTADASGVLFIPYKAGQIAALRSMIATWLRIALFEAMNGPADRDQRLWFVIDELDALGAIDGLKDALARLRKFGGRCVLGFQSIAQVSGTYGAAGAQTLVENCGNTLILRCSSSEHGGTSHFASKLIGDREVIRRQTSRGSDRGAFAARGARHSKNVIEQHVTEAAVMPSQIEQLPDLCGYLKSASSAVWREVHFGKRAGAVPPGAS